jgi:vacuolar-type H+-ATPase subunit E/Vma4
MQEIKRRLTDIEYIEEQNEVMKMQDEAIAELKRIVDNLRDENLLIKNENQRLKTSESIAWETADEVAQRFERLKFRTGSSNLEGDLERLSKRMNIVEVDVSNTKTKVHNVAKQNTELRSGIQRAINKIG